MYRIDSNTHAPLQILVACHFKAAAQELLLALLCIVYVLIRPVAAEPPLIVRLLRNAHPKVP